MSLVPSRTLWDIAKAGPGAIFSYKAAQRKRALPGPAASRPAAPPVAPPAPRPATPTNVAAPKPIYKPPSAGDVYGAWLESSGLGGDPSTYYVGRGMSDKWAGYGTKELLKDAIEGETMNRRADIAANYDDLIAEYGDAMGVDPATGARLPKGATHTAWQMNESARNRTLGFAPTVGDLIPEGAVVDKGNPMTVQRMLGVAPKAEDATLAAYMNMARNTAPGGYHPGMRETPDLEAFRERKVEPSMGEVDWTIPVADSWTRGPAVSARTPDAAGLEAALGGNWQQVGSEDIGYQRPVVGEQEWRRVGQSRAGGGKMEQVDIPLPYAQTELSYTANPATTFLPGAAPAQQGSVDAPALWRDAEKAAGTSGVAMDAMKWRTEQEQGWDPYLQAAAAAYDMDPGELARSVAAQYGVAPDVAAGWFDQNWRNNLLDEDVDTFQTDRDQQYLDEYGMPYSDVQAQQRAAQAAMTTAAKQARIDAETAADAEKQAMADEYDADLLSQYGMSSKDIAATADLTTEDLYAAMLPNAEGGIGDDVDDALDRINDLLDATEGDDLYDVGALLPILQQIDQQNPMVARIVAAIRGIDYDDLFEG